MAQAARPAAPAAAVGASGQPVSGSKAPANPAATGTQPPQSLPLGSILWSPRLAATAGVVLLALLIADRLVLWKRPRWLLRLPDEGLLIPIGWEKVLPLGSRLFRSLKHRPRVLDAWVEEHRPMIQQRFSGITTVEQRRHHLSLPVRVGSAMVPELTPERLKEIGGVGGLVLISGEGGVGKTSLALRIAGWALEGSLTERPAVPVLVEADLQGDEDLLSRVRSTLVALTENRGLHQAAMTPSLPLVRALLERRRLLVILDHFSELGDESRQRLLPTGDDFPSAWAIVTSRREETFGAKVVLHLRPQRLTADRLWPFFTDYLRLVQAEEALDFDLHERAVGRLREITAGIVDEQQAITVLLAKLYIDVVLAERRGAGGALLPASVPALMLTYVRQINAAIPEAERQPRELVVRALQHLAQCSEDTLFRPRTVRREVALRALARASAEMEGTEGSEESGQPRNGLELLRYLVDRLMLVEESPDGQSLRLVLDPLADYLAALGWLRQLDREGDGAWDGFLEQSLPAIGSEGAALAQGFLRALYDSAVHAADPAVLGLEIEPQVLARLAERAAIDPQRIALERERRRLSRLIDDLAEPDLGVRLQAIEEICRRRPSDTHVITALGRVAESEQQDDKAREAAVVALAVLGGAAAATLLSGMAVEADTPLALRRLALEALGLTVSRWSGGAQAAERARIEQMLERLLRSDPIDLLIEGETGWAELDRRLGVLQGASRGLQLAAAADLPLLGSCPGRKVPMLTLTALKEGEALRVRTQVVEPAVWQLPLPGGEQLELVVVDGGVHAIGSLEDEDGRNWYEDHRDGCKGVNVEAQRTVRLKQFALVRHAITQVQWRAVAGLAEVERSLDPALGTYKPDGLWETHAQPGSLPVDSVSFLDGQEWLARLNRWLLEQWSELGGQGESPKLAMPSEGQWEAGCRAGATTPFHFGDMLDASWANFDGGCIYGPGRKGRYCQRPLPVGFFGLVNRWGLVEMHGQLFEWCSDQWHPNPIGEGCPSDGQPWEREDLNLEALGTAQKDWKLLRGGSWFDSPRDCRASIRNSSHPSNSLTNFGVRPCCLLPPGSLLGS